MNTKKKLAIYIGSVGLVATLVAALMFALIPAGVSITSKGHLSIETGMVLAAPDTETLRPNAAGDECNMNQYYDCTNCPNHYTCVDEVTPDGNTTKIGEPSDTVYKRDLYNIADHSEGSGTINSVKVYARCQVDNESTPSKASLKICIKSTTVDESSEITLSSGSYADYSNTWTVNHDTSNAFTWDEIDALQVGIAMREPATGRATYCTQVYVEVDYTAVSCSEDITNTPSSKDFGTVATSSMPTTGLTHFTVTNNSGGAVTITIKAIDWTGGVGWTHSDTATPGADTAGLKAGLEGADYTIIVKKTAAYNTLVAGLADSATQKWGLKLYTPTSFSDGVQKTTTVTLTATCD